jgi:hypothetical protein
LHQRYGLKTIDAELLDIVIIHLADDAWLTTRAQQIVIMESQKYAIFGGVNVGLYVPISQIHCALKCGHGVLWCITGTASVSKGDGVCGVYKRMGHWEN